MGKIVLFLLGMLMLFTTTILRNLTGIMFGVLEAKPQDQKNIDNSWQQVENVR